MVRPRRDPEVTDLRRYRRERERAQKRRAPKAARRGEGFLGSRPKAGLILAAVVVVLVVLSLLQRLH